MNPTFLNQIQKAKDYLIIVEGKKDKHALQQLGFQKIFVINETGKSLGEKIEQIQELCNKKDKELEVIKDIVAPDRVLYPLSGL